MAMWVKIAPGIREDRQRIWADCRGGGYICVGWDAVGDLRKYISKDEFLRAFERKYLKKWYNGRLSVRAGVKEQQFCRFNEQQPHGRGRGKKLYSSFYMW